MWPIYTLLSIAIIVYLFRPRRFYIVRHGETVLNAQGIKQGEEGELSENGRVQAEAVGNFLKPFAIQRIITSTYPRARETAEIINQSLHVSIVYSKLFSERISPTEVIGKSVSDPIVASIIDRTELSYHEDEYRYSDEESFLDLKERARKCLSLMSRQGPTTTCIVTHRAFLKMLIAYLLYRESLHASDFVKLSYFNYSNNAGVTICEFQPWRLFSPTRGWRVISFNEMV